MQRSKIEYKETTLENGLQLVMSYKNEVPGVVINTLVKVGSKDEPENQRGIAHLFEHLMFEGSPNVMHGEFDDILHGIGGDSNAYTTYDVTCYQTTVPSNFIETALWLDSDRLTGFALSEDAIEVQKKVVLEEKLQQYDNTPYGTSEEESMKRLYNSGGYDIPVIGRSEDIIRIKKNDIEKFYELYYNPSNIILTIVGDIDYELTEGLVKKYYGVIKSGKKPHKKKFEDKEIKSEICETIYDNIKLPGRFIYYKIPGVSEREFYVAMLLSGILSSGESSVLYNELVYRKKILYDVITYTLGTKDIGLFVIDSFVKSGIDINKAAEEVDYALNEFCNGSVTENQITKVKNRIETSYYTKHLYMHNIADDLGLMKFYFDNPDRINFDIEEYLSITKDEIMNFTDKYIKNRNRLILNYLPKGKDK